MHRLIFVVLCALHCASFASAQVASVRTLGTSCSRLGKFPMTATLSASAAPKLGTTMRLVYQGPNFYNRQSWTGSWSSATAYMFLGLRRLAVRVGPCTLYSSADVLLVGRHGQPFEMPLTIPNDPMLIGFKLYAQSAFSFIGVTCLSSCQQVTDQGASNALELTLGR